MQPLYSNILVKQDEGKKQTEGGIIIPDKQEEVPLTGVVIAKGDGYVGDDGAVRPLAVQKGDRIIFGKYAGTKIEINEEKFLVMDEADVYGVL